jgi:hypothetical protein
MALIRCASDDVMPQIVVDSTRACIAYRVVWRKTAEEWLKMTVIVIAFIMSSFHSPDVLHEVRKTPLAENRGYCGLSRF